MIGKSDGRFSNAWKIFGAVFQALEKAQKRVRWKPAASAQVGVSMASKWPAVRRMLKWELIKLIMAVIVCAILFLYMRSVVGPKLTKVMHDMTNPSKAPVERKK